MLEVLLDELEEMHLRQLLGSPETLRLEFKQTLELSTQGQRREAAKDVSAFANSAGGRLIYGIAEKRQEDGLRVAEALRPLRDAGLPARLEDLVADTIHPRPHLRHKAVPIQGGGFILVVEIYPGLERDLYMVEPDGRFYRRGETRTIRMSEPEVREAYARIAASSLAVEQALESTVVEQLKLLSDRSQSVLVVPWYPRRDLADPRVLVGIRRELADGPFGQYYRYEPSFWESIANMEAYMHGLRAKVNPNRGAAAAEFGFFITRFGVVRLSVRAVDLEEPPHAEMIPLIGNTLVALDAARFVLDRCNYWGPVRVVQVLRMPAGTSAILHTGPFLSGLKFTAPHVESVVPEVNLRELGDDLEPVACELWDQVFQHLGDVRCPLFGEDGHLPEHVRKRLPWLRQLTSKTSS